MPLRSEEAELRRALELSTQHESVLMRPPHTMSSAPSDDSRDLELRPMQPTGQSGLSIPSSMWVAPSPSTPLRSSVQQYDVLSGSPHPALHPMSSNVEVVLPLRPASRREAAREASVDPIDMLSGSSPIRDGKRTEVALSHSAPVDDTAALTSVERVFHSSGASTSEASRRSSSRVQKQQEEKEAAKAERKRKRDERKALEAAAREAGEKTEEPNSSKKARPSKEPKPRKQTQSSKGEKSSQSARDEASAATTVLSQTTAPASSAPPATHTAQPFVGASPSAPSRRPDASSERSTPSRPGSVPVTAEAASRDVDIATPQGRAAEELASTSTYEPPLRMSPAKPAQAEVSTPIANRPLQATRTTPASVTPNGRPWKTARDDLSSVLSKFPRAKPTGMSKRHRIAPLHASIGPAVKALPPPPPKNKKKIEEEDDDDDEEAEGKIKVGSKEWLMMED